MYNLTPSVRKFLIDKIFCMLSLFLTPPSPLFELFFCKKKFLLVGASSMLWTGQWISESVSE